MKICFLVLFLFAQAVTATAQSGNATRLQRAVLPLQFAVTNPRSGLKTIGTHCTVTSINPAKRLWLTAAHCILNLKTERRYASAYYVAWHEVVPIRIDLTHDLAILRSVDKWSIPHALVIAKDVPQVGDRVEMLGYGYARIDPFYFLGYIVTTNFEFYGSRINVVAFPAIAGGSGGPIVNENGQLIGVLHIGFGCETCQYVSPLAGITTFDTLQTFWQYTR